MYYDLLCNGTPVGRINDLSRGPDGSAWGMLECGPGFEDIRTVVEAYRSVPDYARAATFSEREAVAAYELLSFSLWMAGAHTSEDASVDLTPGDGPLNVSVWYRHARR